MTKGAARQWKVGLTQPMTDRQLGESGYGFNVTDAHGAPILSVIYDTEDEAKDAANKIREALSGALSVTGRR